MKLHELEKRRDTIAREMRQLNETIGDDDWSVEQRGQFGDMQKSLKDLDSDIVIQTQLRSLDNDHNQTNNDNKKEQDEQTPGQRHNAAFENLYRHGFTNCTSEEREILKRAQNKGTDSAGGFTVPVDFQSFVIESMKAYGGVANHCFLLNTDNGQTLPWSTTDGTTDVGDFIAEGAKAGNQDIVFGQVDIGAKKLTSKVILISNELLRDTGVRMEDIIGGRIASRIGRKEASAIITGTGTGLQNKGLAMQVTSYNSVAVADTITFQDINTLRHSVDPAYRNNNAALAFNDNTLLLLENQVDSQNRPLWMPAVAGMTPSTIMNSPYFIDQGIADASATGDKFMYYGDWKRFILRRVAGMQMRRLDELYAESDQVAFLAFHRFDTLLEDTAAIKGLTYKVA